MTIFLKHVIISYLCSLHIALGLNPLANKKDILAIMSDLHVQERPKYNMKLLQCPNTQYRFEGSVNNMNAIFSGSFSLNATPLLINLNKQHYLYMLHH